MKITGKTPDQFLPVYLQECRPDISLSETTVYTISNILQTFVMLALDGSGRKLTIKQLALKAGYSRTTIYTYFEDIIDIQRCIEEMIFLHQCKNVMLYWQCLLNNLTPQEDAQIIETVVGFQPYINAILQQDSAFFERYQDYLLKSFYNVARGGGISKEIRPILCTAIASALATIILDKPEPDSLSNGLTAAKIIVKSVFDYGQKLKHSS